MEVGLQNSSRGMQGRAGQSILDSVPPFENDRLDTEDVGVFQISRFLVEHDVCGLPEHMYICLSFALIC